MIDGAGRVIEVVSGTHVVSKKKRDFDDYWARQAQNTEIESSKVLQKLCVHHLCFISRSGSIHLKDIYI